MLEADPLITFLDSNSEPGIIHHSQDGPVHISWLAHHGLVHGSDEDVIRIPQLKDRNVVRPEAPAEAGVSAKHVEPSAEHVDIGFTEPVFGVVDFRKPPCYRRV